MALCSPLPGLMGPLPTCPSPSQRDAGGCWSPSQTRLSGAHSCAARDLLMVLATRLLSRLSGFTALLCGAGWSGLQGLPGWQCMEPLQVGWPGQGAGGSPPTCRLTPAPCGSWQGSYGSRGFVHPPPQSDVGSAGIPPNGNLAPRHPALPWSLTHALLPAPLAPHSPALISLGPAGIALSHLVQPARG